MAGLVHCFPFFVIPVHCFFFIVYNLVLSLTLRMTRAVYRAAVHAIVRPFVHAHGPCIRVCRAIR